MIVITSYSIHYTKLYELVVEDFVDETGVALPVVIRQRIGERHVPLEVVVRCRETVEVLHIEHLAAAARAVPERDAALRVQSLELIEDVGAHRCHTGAAAHEYRNNFV